MDIEDRIDQAEECLRTYILEHGQSTGTISWQMALQSLGTLIAYRKTTMAIWKSACPDTLERWQKGETFEGAMAEETLEQWQKKLNFLFEQKILGV